MVEFYIMVILFVLGILYAIIATMVGIGGGLLYVPTLVFAFGLATNDAGLISSFAIVFTSFSGATKHFKSKRIDFRTALLYLTMAIPGSIIGGLVAENIDETLLKQLFAIFIGISAIRGIIKAYMTRNDADYMPKRIESYQENELERKLEPYERRIIDGHGDVYEYKAKIDIGLGFALLGGFLAGLLGVGGGIIFVPLLTTITGIPMHVGVATSTSMITIVSLISVATRFTRRAATGSLDLQYILSYGIPLSMGAVIGAYIGASRVKKLKSRELKLMFWIVAFVAAVRMFLT